MARPSTILVVFMISVNAFAGMTIAMEIDEALGLNTELGQCNEVDVDNPREGCEEYAEAEQQTQNVNTGSSLGDTLFGMYNTLARGVGSIYKTVYPGLDLMSRAGVHDRIVMYLGHVFSFVIAFDIMSYVRGWGL